MISTKARYAIRVMLDLSQHHNEGYIPLKAIAGRQEISEKYLEIIIKLLVKGKFVKGLRGKGGGYMLTRTPEEYKIGEIIEQTEGPFACVSCQLADAEACPRKSHCLTLPMWDQYTQLSRDFFYRITLEDLLKGNV